MKKDEHYGIIPGCKRPSLLKPGAEILCLTFRFNPRFEIRRNDVERMDLPEGHREYEVICTLGHIVSDQVFGQGVGCCSTVESRYRCRTAKRACPECGQETIGKGKKEWGGGWFCGKNRGGCGAKFPDGNTFIEDQKLGKIENPDLADCYNTVLKIGKKRALVDAVLTATAASDSFTQDIEEMPPEDFGGRTSVPRDAAKAPQSSRENTNGDAATDAQKSLLERFMNDDRAQTMVDGVTIRSRLSVMLKDGCTKREASNSINWVQDQFKKEAVA